MGTAIHGGAVHAAPHPPASGPKPRPPAEASAAEPRERDLGFTWTIFVASLLPRLYVAIAWAREPVWDGHYYDFGAKRIAAGHGYSDDVIIAGRAVWHPWCHYPVGYSAFLGLLYRIFGAGPHVATIANAVTGAILCAVVHRLARRATTPLRARLAAILTALSPGLILYSALLMTEPLAALGIVTAAWLFAREHRTVRRGVSAGVVMGLTALVRPQSLLCVPALALLALPAIPSEPPSPDLRRNAPPIAPWRSRLLAAARPTALAIVTTLAVVAPWTARNCYVMDACALVSTNAGWNLAIGAFPRATGRFETLHASDGCEVVTGQVQQDRCWLHEGLRWIARSPRRWLGLVPDKLSFTFDHESFPLGYLGEADPKHWPEWRKAQGRDALSAVHRVLLGLAALGVIAWPFARGMRARERVVQGALAAVAVGLAAWGIFADRHPAWLLAVFLPVVAALPFPGRPRNGGVVGYSAFAVATVVVTHAVFFGEDRYHMVVTPVLCLLAACALRCNACEPTKSGTAPHFSEDEASRQKGNARSTVGGNRPQALRAHPDAASGPTWGCRSCRHLQGSPHQGISRVKLRRFTPAIDGRLSERDYARSESRARPLRRCGSLPLGTPPGYRAPNGSSRPRARREPGSEDR